MIDARRAWGDGCTKASVQAYLPGGHGPRAEVRGVAVPPWPP